MSSLHVCTRVDQLKEVVIVVVGLDKKPWAYEALNRSLLKY